MNVYIIHIYVYKIYSTRNRRNDLFFLIVRAHTHTYTQDTHMYINCFLENFVATDFIYLNEGSTSTIISVY